MIANTRLRHWNNAQLRRQSGCRRPFRFRREKWRQPSRNMEPRTLQTLANTCGAQLMNCRKDTVFTGVCTDSRQPTRGVLFWALTGDRFDGHEFVAKAIESGAVAAVVAHAKLESMPKNLPLVVVTEPLAALGEFAAKYRQEFSPTVIGVAGSN